MQIILASASARRKDLLQSLGVKFKVIPSEIDEETAQKKIKNPKTLVKKLSFVKALAIKPLAKKAKTDFLIISADTIGVLENKILGKPKSRLEAKQMLEFLSNKTHQVLTGLTFLSLEKQTTILVITKVRFKKLSNKQIEDYLDTNVYLDRAASYGIQDEKCNFVKDFQGSYTNILGLPLENVNKLLKEFAVKIKKRNNHRNNINI